MTVTFPDGLQAAKGLPCSQDALRCIDALRDRYDVLTDDVPVLRAVYGALDQSLAAVTPGTFVIRVSAADPKALCTAVALVTPGLNISKRRALRLYSDAWFALSEWIVAWNRKQIKRVA
jgi:hypothetical protein